MASRFRRISATLFCKQSSVEEVLLLRQQKQGPVQTYGALIRECKCLEEGKRLHQHIISNGHSRNSFLGNLLVQMYGRCGSLEDAKSAFETIPERNVFSWSLMIAAFSQNGHHQDALDLFHRMLAGGLQPDCFVTASVLRACANLEDLKTGREIHARIVSKNLESNLVVETALLSMYAKTGQVDDARATFDSMTVRDVIAWNAMLAAYVQEKQFTEAIRLYHEMNCQGVVADEFTFATVLSACSGLKDLSQGRSTHACVESSGMGKDDGIFCALLNMYVKCGSLNDAEKVFNYSTLRKNVVSWTTMITAYAQAGHTAQVFKLYHLMNLHGDLPNSVTFTSILNACSCIGLLHQGCKIHERIVSTGYESNLVVQNSLLNMYAKCGSLANAKRIFDGICDEQRDSISWNAMLAAYAQLGDNVEALNFYGRMGIRGIDPDEATFTSVLGACAKIGDLDYGRRIHAHLQSTRFNHLPGIQAALINMYAKCASSSRHITKFVLRRTLSLVFCNSFIAAHAMYGHTKRALKLFREMQLDGVRPNNITFISLLAACSRSCFHVEGGELFRSLRSDYGMMPEVDHYRCMIHLLGRSGYVKSAKRLIETMEYEPGDVEWTSLLGTCRLHGWIKIGREAAARALELNPRNETAYVLLLNLNSAARRVVEAKRKWRKKLDTADSDKKPRKEPTWRTFQNARHKKKNQWIEKLRWRGGMKDRRRQQLAVSVSRKASVGPTRMRRFKGYLSEEVWTG